MLKKIACLLLWWMPCSLHAQSYPSDSVLGRVFQTDVLLHMLMDSAVSNSPDVKRSKKSIAMFEHNLQATKVSLLNSILITSSYGYGNTGSLLFEKDLVAANQGNVYSNIQSVRYNMAVNLQLPLGVLLSRKPAAQALQMQVGMAEDERDRARLFVQQEVIKMYQEVKLAHAHVLTAARIRQTAFISMNMAQKNFMDGQVTVEQLSKMQNDYSQTTMEYDTQLNQFQTSFLILQAYTGVQLTKLINLLR